MSTLREKLDQFESRCKEKNLRVTVQKRKIFEELLRKEEHPTADEVYRSVQEEMPEVSRTTVYRVLETLVDLGLVDKVYHPEDQYRFDPNTSHHHHLVCRNCDRVIDFEPDDRGEPELPDVPEEMFDVTDYSIYFKGVCRDCRPEGEETVEQATSPST